MKNLSIENRFAAVVALLKWDQYRVESELGSVNSLIAVDLRHSPILADYRQWSPQKKRNFAMRFIVNRFNHQ
jgi:hypothetical protein